MKLYMKALLITLVCAVGIGLLFLKWSNITQSEEGSKNLAMMDHMETQGLMDFKGETLDGKEISLKQFEGKVVVLNFWASWCGPCIEEFPSLVRLAETMKGKVEIIAVSEDSAKQDIETFLKSFPQTQNPYFHIVWDKDRSIGQMYDAERLPESYIASKDLKMAKKVVGSIPWDTKEALQFMHELSEKK